MSLETLGDNLLKNATQMHAVGDINGAIECLRDAYRYLAEGDAIYPIEVFLRLPLYLQKAGRFEESVYEFEQLLKDAQQQVNKDFAHQNAAIRTSLVAMSRQTVYDKMRIAHKRQGLVSKSALYGILSRAMWCQGLYYQKRIEELNRSKSPEIWQEFISKLLKSAKMEHKIEKILAVCVVFLEVCDIDSFEKLNNVLQELIL